MWVTDLRQGGKGELFDTWPRCGETRCTVGEWVIEEVCGEILWDSGCELRVGGWWEGVGENCMAFTRVGDSGGMWECQSTSLMGESWLLWPTTSESQNLSYWIGKHRSFGTLAIWTYSLLFIDNGWLLIFMQRFVLFIYYQIDTVQKRNLIAVFLVTRDAIKTFFTPGLGRCSGILNGDRWHIPISLRHIENYGQCPKNKQNHPKNVEWMVDVILKAVLGLS